jgi:hypothetical protein
MDHVTHTMTCCIDWQCWPSSEASDTGARGALIIIPIDGGACAGVALTAQAEADR